MLSWSLVNNTANQEQAEFMEVSDMVSHQTITCTGEGHVTLQLHVHVHWSL